MVCWLKPSYLCLYGRISRIPAENGDQGSVGQEGGDGFLWAALGLPVFIVVLRGDDDHNGKDGAEHNRGDAHCQTDEGEVTCLA